jgi:hypothetical protein
MDMPRVSASGSVWAIEAGGDSGEADGDAAAYGGRSSSRRCPRNGRKAAFRSMTAETAKSGFPELSTDALLETPALLIGTVADMAARLFERRERFGFSYVVVQESSMEALAPVIEASRVNEGVDQVVAGVGGSAERRVQLNARVTRR